MKTVDQEINNKVTIEAGTTTLEGICKVLEEAEVEYLFGLPGGNMSKLYPELYDNDKVKAILVRHEQVASIMAEVYGRLTKKPGVYTSQGAWAIANGTMGAIEALQGGSPMLILTDMSDNAPFSHHAPYQIGTGEYGGYDVKKSMEAVTKYTTAVYNAEQAIQSTQLAIKHSISGNPGPVSVVFHSNAFKDKVKEDGPKIYHTRNYMKFANRSETVDKIKQASEKLLTSKKPFIIAGSGVNLAQANDELREISELIGAPVGTTAGGKSALEETHQHSVGVMGNWGHDVANEFLSEADTVLVVGSRLTPTDTVFESEELINPAKQNIIQIDIEEKNASWTYPVDLSLIGDAKTILNQIKDYMNVNRLRLTDFELNNRTEEIKARKEQQAFMCADEKYSDDTPILPQRVAKELEEVIDKKSIITFDSGENRVLLTKHLQTKSPRSIIAPTASGAMGYAMPAALAAKLVHRDSEVFAVCGDGGFPMTMNALLTAIQYDLKITVIVLNNSALGWVKNNQGARQIASVYGEHDYSKIGKGLGCEGIRVTDPDKIGEALQKAKESKKSTVIDIVTTDQESFRKAQSTLMRNRK
ncbi:thiamine pyrophosphate-binding protein [Oceanobacillus sp. CF4.6]|uniref:thiamine pyrophosphate-binding protein n=1 Tax=Oceanobacillus sp. CF4.6 TaxID=3373080 RepID=UPI003EE76B74